MVPTRRIELRTFPLRRGCSTTELRRRGLGRDSNPRPTLYKSAALAGLSYRGKTLVGPVALERYPVEADDSSGDDRLRTCDFHVGNVAL